MKRTYWFRFSATEQLALYQVFHQHPTNRLLHFLALPLVLYSGFIVLALLTGNYTLNAPSEWPLSLPLNAGFFLLVGSIGLYAFLDKGTALAVLVWTLPLWLLSNWTIEQYSAVFLITFSTILQGLGWYVAVYWGHEKVEPFIEVAHEERSTNWYFKQHWYVLRKVGRQPTRLDAWMQYSIAPFDSTLDLLFALGYRPSWKAEIEALCQQKTNALANGEVLFDSLQQEQPSW